RTWNRQGRLSGYQNLVRVKDVKEGCNITVRVRARDADNNSNVHILHKPRKLWVQRSSSGVISSCSASEPLSEQGKRRWRDTRVRFGNDFPAPRTVATCCPDSASFLPSKRI